MLEMKNIRKIYRTESIETHALYLFGFDETRGARVPGRRGTAVAGYDRVVGQRARELPQHALRVQRRGIVHRARLGDLPPVPHPALDASTP